MCATVAAAMLAAAGAAAVRGAPPLGDGVVREGVLTTAPDLHALTKGCGPLREIVEPSSVVGWVDDTVVLPYQTPVPAAGWFFRDAPEPGDVSPRPERVLRSMWSGARALWVSQTAGPEALAAAKAFASDNPDLRLDVYVWPAERDALPRDFAFAAWGVTQECDELDRDVAVALLRAAHGAPGVAGQEPPQAFGDLEETSS